jgi:hypothetical protein
MTVGTSLRSNRWSEPNNLHAPRVSVNPAQLPPKSPMTLRATGV